MATRSPTREQLRSDVAAEREQLTEAVDHLRAEMRAKLPVFAAGALGVGFFVAGGIGATRRLLVRRGREGREKARFGRFRLVDRD